MPAAANSSVNGRKLDEYFPRAHLQTVARQPLVTAGYDGSPTSRSACTAAASLARPAAVRHGLARALTLEIDPASSAES